MREKKRGYRRAGLARARRCACALPGRYVDLQDPGFQVLIQHDVEAEELVAAVRRFDVHFHIAVNVRLGAGKQARQGGRFKSSDCLDP